MWIAVLAAAIAIAVLIVGPRRAAAGIGIRLLQFAGFVASIFAAWVAYHILAYGLVIAFLLVLFVGAVALLIHLFTPAA